LPIVGAAMGAAFMAFVWYPHSIVEWFVASLVPAAVAYGLGRVPEGFRPPPAAGIAAGIWLALFWIPVIVTAGHVLGILP